MLVKCFCPRMVMRGAETVQCGASIEVEVEIPPLALVAPADNVELAPACFYGHRWDAEEVAIIRADINAEVLRLEDEAPTQEFQFPEISPLDDADHYLPEDAA